MAESSKVYGVHAVRWLLKEHPERVRQLWLQSTRDDVRTEEIAALARAAGISVQRVDARKLDDWTHSGNLVFMLILGGFAHFLGPVLGAFVFIFLQDQVMSLTPYWRFVFGGILATVVLFFPRGLTGLLPTRGRASA